MADLKGQKQPRDPSLTKSLTDAEALAWNKAIERQYLHCGGWCGRCGEACEPFTKNLPQEFRGTACEYNGDHPDCGDHDMVLTHKASETLGNYEIHECQNDNCDYAESY